MERIGAEIQLGRETLLLELAVAFQRRDLTIFEKSVRPDMTLTLAGSSHLAGTYMGYGAFGRYLQELRRVLRSASKTIKFVHEKDEMTFSQVMVLSGPKHDVEMTLVVTVLYDEEGKIASFLVMPEDQGLFDYVVDSSVPAGMFV